MSPLVRIYSSNPTRDYVVLITGIVFPFKSVFVCACLPSDRFTVSLLRCTLCYDGVRSLSDTGGLRPPPFLPGRVRGKVLRTGTVVDYRLKIGVLPLFYSKTIRFFGESNTMKRDRLIGPVISLKVNRVFTVKKTLVLSYFLGTTLTNYTEF